MSQMVRDYSRVTPTHYHDVEVNARRLAILHSVVVELTRVTGGWIARTPELSEKLALALVTFEDAEAAADLEVRLRELRASDADIAADLRRSAPALGTLERADDCYAFIAGLARVVKPAFVADLRRQLDAAPPYVDEPSVRILKRVISEQEGHIAKLSALLADRGVSWAAHAELEGRLRRGLWDLYAPDGAMTRDVFVGQAPITLQRPAWPAAVRQLEFEDAGDPYPTEFEAAMRRCVHDLVFSEVEALDIFGHYVYAFADAELPWEFHRAAARIAWDEARHVELLLNVLERYGGSVGEFPAKAPGYEEYIRQDSILEKLIMVNVIAEGEVSTDTQTQHRDAFRELGDELSATLKDYEMADEVVHGRFGLIWSRWLADRDGEDWSAAYQRAFSALEEFKNQHDDEGGDSPIPLVRLGQDETGSKRVLNIEAKKLVGFSDEEIARLREQPGSVLESG